VDSIRDEAPLAPAKPSFSKEEAPGFRPELYFVLRSWLN
jgi:hypothetical protein